MSQRFPPAILNSILAFICILIAVPASHGDDNVQYKACRSPYNYKCGPLSVNISYPFWANDVRPQYCGQQQFELKCEKDDQFPYDQFPIFQIQGDIFRVLEINEIHQFMRLAAGANTFSNLCLGMYQETIIHHALFSYSENVRNLSIFSYCHGELSWELGKNNFSCKLEGGMLRNGFYTIDNDNYSRLRNLSNSCSRVDKVPFQNTSENFDYLSEGNLSEVLRHGFEMRYHVNNKLCSECYSSQGICGSYPDSNEFSCLCHDQPHRETCSRPGEKNKLRVNLGIGIGAAFSGMAIMVATFLIYLHYRKNKQNHSALVPRKTSSDPSSKSDLEKGDNFLGVHVFSYTELEKATNNFDSARELGDGGFGTVYYGKLRDGRVVAVKRLYEKNYKRVEQFMNEVEILAHLRHQNLVSLYGRSSRHSRELLLVYEYIPNGTVADHLHGILAKPGALPWPTRLKIAIETASALTYLHASDIIHRDVKTNNILLDCNFGVKVADFGLSRLFPTHVTHVSTAPQGTPGYVDPEYHKCYQLTEKSDVFSFGVVLIELISSMRAVDITRHRHEINLSNMAINKIKKKALHELVDPTLGYESDSKGRKEINAVAELAFRSLQNKKDLRPFMKDILEALKDIESDGYNTKKFQLN